MCVCVCGWALHFFLGVFFLRIYTTHLARTLYTLKKTLHTPAHTQQTHTHVDPVTTLNAGFFRLFYFFFIFSFLVFSSSTSVFKWTPYRREVHYTYVYRYFQCVLGSFADTLHIWWTLYSFSPDAGYLVFSDFSVQVFLCCVCDGWCCLVSLWLYNFIEFKEFIFIRSCLRRHLEWDTFTRRCNAKHVFAWNSFVSWSKLSIGSLVSGEIYDCVCGCERFMVK